MSDPSTALPGGVHLIDSDFLSQNQTTESPKNIAVIILNWQLPKATVSFLEKGGLGVVWSMRKCEHLSHLCLPPFLSPFYL